MDVQGSSTLLERNGVAPDTAEITPIRTPEIGGRPPNGDRPAGRARRRWRRHHLIWALSVVGAAGLAAAILRPTPIAVDLGVVVRGPLEVTVDADGTTRVRDHFRVAAPVGGRLQRITLREGDRVEAGSILARIQAAPLDPRAALEARARLAGARAALEEAAARVAQTHAALEQADRTANRIGVVAAAGAISVEAWELSELERETAARDHAAAGARLAAAESAEEAARRELALADPGDGESSVAVVRAPTGGRVLRVHDASERVVAPGTPLVDLAEDERLEIVVDVLSTEAVRIQPGATMHVVNWGGADTLEARVRLVEPSGFTKVSALGVEEQRVRVIADLTEPGPGIGDGYRVEARIVTWSSSDVVKLPTAAMVRRGEGWGVFAVADGRARMREIQIGQRGAEEAVVRSGLAQDDLVVLFPPDGLEDGIRVRAR